MKKLKDMTIVEIQETIAKYIAYDTFSSKQRYGEVIWLVEQVINKHYDAIDCGFDFLFKEEE